MNGMELVKQAHRGSRIWAEEIWDGISWRKAKGFAVRAEEQAQVQGVDRQTKTSFSFMGRSRLEVWVALPPPTQHTKAPWEIWAVCYFSESHWINQGPTRKENIHYFYGENIILKVGFSGSSRRAPRPAASASLGNLKLHRKANSQALPEIYWIRNSGVQPL